MSRIKQFPTPSPAFGLALFAVVLSATGLAFAAIPDSKSVIHSCYAKPDGALRVIKGTKCQPGEKKLSWNQRGRRGAAGATNVKVRSANLTLHWNCTYVNPNFSCTTPATTATVHCNPGERATGGGYGEANDGTAIDAVESKPAPTVGIPTGWVVTAGASGGTPAAEPLPDTLVPIYAVCAAP